MRVVNAPGIRLEASSPFQVHCHLCAVSGMRKRPHPSGVPRAHGLLGHNWQAPYASHHARTSYFCFESGALLSLVDVHTWINRWGQQVDGLDFTERRIQATALWDFSQAKHSFDCDQAIHWPRRAPGFYPGHMESPIFALAKDASEFWASVAFAGRVRPPGQGISACEHPVRRLLFLPVGVCPAGS